MDDQSYWLFRWIDKYQIRSIADAEAALERHKALDDLQQMADDAAQSMTSPLGQDVSVLAGRGLDLSGTLDCTNPECQKREVDELFRHVWHYFDRIVLADNLSHDVAKHWSENEAKARKSVLHRIAVLLYIRELKAEDLVQFRDKPPATDWRNQVDRIPVADFSERNHRVVDILLRDAIFTVRASGDELQVDIKHPQIKHRSTLCWKPQRGAPSLSINEIKQTAAQSLVDLYSSHLVSDLTAAQYLRLPLGSSLYLHREILTASEGARPEDVAFHLNLPVLNEIPIETLVRLRRDERDHFIRFQKRLRDAIAERCKLEVTTSSADKIANQIRSDLIEPELRNIEARLRASERLFAQKAGVGMYLGFLATTCGVLVGTNPVVALGAGIATTITTTAAAASKLLEERRDTTLDNMYFLWQATKG